MSELILILLAAIALSSVLKLVVKRSGRSLQRKNAAPIEPGRCYNDCVRFHDGRNKGFACAAACGIE